MKRLILFIFPLLTVLGFSAHDNKEAEEKIKKEIEKIMIYHKTGGKEEREKLLIANRLDRDSVGYFIMNSIGEIMTEGHRKSEYKINNIRVDGNEAVIIIDYRGPDLRQEAEKFRKNFEKSPEINEKIKKMSKNDSKKYFAEEFEKYINNARVIISHAGVGTILKGVKLGKKMIVAARMKNMVNMLMIIKCKF